MLAYTVVEAELVQSRKGRESGREMTSQLGPVGG